MLEHRRRHCGSEHPSLKRMGVVRLSGQTHFDTLVLKLFLMRRLTTLSERQRPVPGFRRLMDLTLQL